MFKGVLTPVITIFDEQGNVDYKGSSLQINRLIDSGINGLLFLGSLGEFFALQNEEKTEYIRFVVKEVNKRVPVLIGTGGTIQERVIELTQFAEQAGADGVVVVSPYYFPLNTENLYRYYANLARSTTLPIVLYNFPGGTSVNLEPELVLKLAKEFSHIVGIKDTVDCISHTRRLIQVVKDACPDFRVFSGYDEYLIPNLMAGGDGVICGLTNVMPDVFVTLMEAYKRNDLRGVIAGQKKISLLMNLYDISQPFVAAIKGAVAAQGVPISPVVKEPMGTLEPDQVAKIKILMDKVKQLKG